MSHDVDRQARRRRNAVRASAIALLTIAFGVVSTADRLSSGEARAVDIVRAAAFVIVAAVVTLRSTTSVGIAKRAPALDDELTTANRVAAARAGFLALMTATIALYLLSFSYQVKVAEGAPVLIFVGAATSAFRFSVLEMRGDADE